MRAGMLHDTRIQSALSQIVALLLLGAVVFWLAGNTFTNLSERGITSGFDFLDRAARFPIAESLLAYRPSDSFGWAFVVGLGNTLFMAAITAIGATLLGLIVGLARRSRHPLARGLSTVYVEALRNTPLVVQLLFWYALVTMGLPGIHAALNPLDDVFLADRGLYLPRPSVSGHGSALMWVLAAGAIAIAAAVAYGRRARRLRGGSKQYVAIATVLVLAAAFAAWHLGGMELGLERPVLARYNFVGGMNLSPEFTAMFLGLLLYSASFIGEVIRGGIDAVDRGQWEAARSIGLSERHTLRLVVMPQALRVIIPPMTSQYISIIKNTTLALAVGYPDISLVTATTINQTGQALEGILVLVLVFLSISVAASVFMNRYNQHVARAYGGAR